jgi:hypothetical protein
MTIEEAHAEVKYGWSHSYSAEAIAHAVESLMINPSAIASTSWRAPVLPRNLFSHARPLRLVEGDLGESRHHLQTRSGKENVAAIRTSAAVVKAGFFLIALNGAA